MQDTVGTHLLRGRSVGLVPTMGALHAGHMGLVRTSKTENDLTAVSIFVNPAQFGPKEDYASYPREPEQDIEKLKTAGVDFLFMPEAKAIYPESFSTSVSVGELSRRLCGEFRPGHFDGVATVVAKLLNLVRPTRAYFGQKDYQQFLIIKRMADDLSFPVEIVPCPTWREEDGLAMSSRNAYLSAEERKAAAVIYKSLNEAAELLKSGEAGPKKTANHLRRLLEAEPNITEVQYAGVYDPKTLDALSEFKGKAVLAVAVRMGKGRLIDNILI
jgi:pantoate--beta-alanine ligase